MITIIPLTTPHRFAAGDDVVDSLLRAAHDAGITLQADDIVCVASKVVALAEGQSVPVAAVSVDKHDSATLASDPSAAADPSAASPAPDASHDGAAIAATADASAVSEVAHREARRQLAREHAAAIVADTPQVLITRTHHGFVVANNGIDGSNLADDHLLLLPDDPDASARTIRAEVASRCGVTVGVIITDTFGRAWRNGQTDVAIGLAGVPAFRDERESGDLDGRALVVTEPALADELAAAADLARTKASSTPFVVIRGLTATDDASSNNHQDSPETSGARALVRPASADLFAVGGPNASEQAVAARRTVRAFDVSRPIPRTALEAAARAAATAPAPHHTRPWRLVRLSDATRTALLDAMATQWREDLAADGTPLEVIDRRVARSDQVLRQAPELLAAFVDIDGAHSYPDQRRQQGERDLFILSGGAALQNAQIVLAAHGIGAAWISSTAFCPPVVRNQLGVPDSWQPTGMLAVGYPQQQPPPRGTVAFDDVLLDH